MMIRTRNVVKKGADTVCAGSRTGVSVLCRSFDGLTLDSLFGVGDELLYAVMEDVENTLIIDGHIGFALGVPIELVDELSAGFGADGHDHQ